MKLVDFPVYDNPVERYIIPDDHEEVIKYITDNVTLLSCDTETYYNMTLDGAISRYIAGEPNNCPFCLTLTYQDKETEELVSVYVEEEAIPLYKGVLENPEIAKIAHNIKYDAHILLNIGIDIFKSKVLWDTMIMIHLIDEEHMCKMPDGSMRQTKALKNLAYHYLGEESHKYEDLVDEVRRVIALRTDRVKSKVSYKEAAEACPRIMKDYACSDTEFTYQLYQKFYAVLIKQELLKAYEVDINATKAVFAQERAGLKVNIPYYNALRKTLVGEMMVCTSEIFKLMPIELNINSAADLVEGFAKLGVKWEWFTDKGEQKTDDRTLSHIIKYYDGEPPSELATLVLQYREAAKLSNTFIAQIFDYVQRTGRIHPDFNVCPRDDSAGGTKTGRLSSSNPNLQNLPVKDDRIIKGIIPEEGYVLVKFDYSQQEYRLLGHYSGDENFKQIIYDGKDIHVGTAELLLKLSHEEASLKPNRNKGKTLNFALVYGLGMAALANSLGLKIDEPKYKAAGWLLRGWGYVPWDMPSLSVALSRCKSEEEMGQVEYYYSVEATAAVNEAKAIKEEYFAQFPRIQTFLKDCTGRAKQRGWVKTWTGRRRHFKKPKEEGYKAPNAVIQGG